jgi:hypothetical protein
MSPETPPIDRETELSLTRTEPATFVKDPAQELSKHLKGIRERLSSEFQPRVPAEVVDREVALAAAAFDGARVVTYVPVLVSRQVRLKLRELSSSTSSAA